MVIFPSSFRTFALTVQLLPTIQSSGTALEPSRIIHVSSMLNIIGRFDVDSPDFNLEKQPFDSTKQYANTKLLLNHYNSELARRLECTNCESVALHPGKQNTFIPKIVNIFYYITFSGVVSTDVYRESSPGVQQFTKRMCLLTGKNCWQGAQTTIFAAVSREPMNGRYLSDCRDEFLLKSWSIGNSALEGRIYRLTKEKLNL